MDILKMFPKYTLTAVPRSQNISVDSLATTRSNLKVPMNSSNRFEIHVKHRPTIPNNLRYWQVFWDDNEINAFFQNKGKFKNDFIDDICDFDEQYIEVNQMDVLQLKDNVIPRGLIPLEELFDQDDVARKPTLVPTDKEVEDVNLGTTDQLKLVKLSKTLSTETKTKYVKLLSKFSNVFVWDYSDLKVYDKKIIQHTIPIKLDQKTFRQNFRRINPKLLPSIKKEVNRLFKAGIIVPIRFSDWISSLVPVQKKTREIRLCIDFLNLNKVSLKDNYPLPKKDHIMQRVVGASQMSLLDGYSGYNQILVHEKDQDITSFTTQWGTFQYAKVPFGLKNVGATFQWEIDITFTNEKDVFLVVYLDDLTIFSGLDDEHLHHLRTVFQKCRKFKIFLNPKKSLFYMEEGKLLGHIISKDGIRIDPSRVEAIQQIEFLRNKKEIQAFNGKMNFLRRFIPNLAEHLHELTNMLKKNNAMKWTEDAMKSFNLVKLALTIALVLISPTYTHDFIIFSFASENTLAVVLMQKKDHVEQPIAFFSWTIRDSALRYNIIEKQALALIKALKDFQVYILHSHTIAYVPNVAIKDVLMQTNPEGRRGKWIAEMLEYNLEVKPTKLIKGQGLEKLMAKLNLHALDINIIATMSDDEDGDTLIQVSDMFLKSPWYYVQYMFFSISCLLLVC